MKKQVIIKEEKILGRDGVSIYVGSELSKHITDARSLLRELRFIEALGEYKVIYK